MNNKIRKLIYIRQKNAIRNGCNVSSLIKYSLSIDVNNEPSEAVVTAFLNGLKRKWRINFKLIRLDWGQTEDDFIKNLITLKIEFAFVSK